MADLMTLKNEDVGRIGEYVKPWLRELVEEVVPHPEVGGVGTQLLERMVRVEEELKAQRTLMDERFGFMERRFEVLDKRFEDLIGYMNARFEAVDKRFEAVDKRFEDLISQMNARFETVDRRFEESRANLDSRFKTLTWVIGVGFAVITSLTTLFALLA